MSRKWKGIRKAHSKLILECLYAADVLDENPLAFKGDWHEIQTKRRKITARKAMINGRDCYEFMFEGLGDERPILNIRFDKNSSNIISINKHDGHMIVGGSGQDYSA